MSAPATVDEVIARLRAIDAGLRPDDGVAVFNRMYLTVTERVAAAIAGPVPTPAPTAAPTSTVISFRDPATMAAFDVRFANLWLTAFDADAAGRSVSPAWRPLFGARSAGRLPIQYAVAGMNAHIEHDLPIAVIETCRARGLEPQGIHDDYETVNTILSEVESPVRRSFLDEIGRAADDRVGPVVHVLSTWDIDTARDLAWVTAETLWELRRTSLLRARFLDGLAHTVGMTSSALLIPT